MSYSNRVAALLAGCPDPGGVLDPQTAPAVRPPGAPAPRRVPPSPKVTQLVLPTSGITLRRLAERLGLPVFVVMRELIKAGWFFPHDALLDLATARQLCFRLGVSVVPAI